jgi:hypothetical protein
MIEAKRTASLSEWLARFEKLIEEAEADGVDVTATTCCCGEGLTIERDWDIERVL